jgi:hypothetical protein
MRVNTPVHSIHVFARCILLLLFPILPPGFAEGYWEFHRSLFAATGYVREHGGEGKASVITSGQSAEPNLLNAAFALAGLEKLPLADGNRPQHPRTFSVDLLVTLEAKESVIGESISTLST